MANQYFQHGTPLTRHTLARAEMLNGIFQSIEAGFDKLADPEALREGLSRFLEDTGAVDAYLVAFDPAATAYTRGMSFLMGAANSNTGPATINVNGLGVKPILRADGTALLAGDILAGMAVWLVYDGTNFRMVGATGAGGGTQGPPGEDGEDGAPGTPGLSVAELTIYRRSATPPAQPTGGSFNFGTRTLTPPDGWSVGIPAGAGDAYASVAFAAIEGTTGIDSDIAWSAPVRALSDGASANVVFRRSATQPATPAPSAGIPADWYDNVGDVPAGADRMWAMFGSRPDAASNWTWQTPLPVEGIDGEAGEQGPPGDPGEPGAPGSNSILGLLSNETHTVASSASGGGYDLTGAGGTFFVWDGITPVTGSGPVYSVLGVATKNGLTINIDATTGVYALSGAADSWTTDQEQFTLRAAYGGVNIDRIYTISKSRAGQDGEGASAYLLSITASAQAFKYNGLGQLVAPSQISFTALRQNSAAPVSWVTQRWNGSAWVNTASNRMSQASGLTSNLTEAAFAAENTDALRVVASMTEGAVTYTDSITVVKLADGADGPPGSDGQDGSDAVLGLLSNEAHVVSAASDGTGYSLTGAGGTFRVWDGITQVTGAGPVYSVVAPATVDGLTMSINAASGVYALSGGAWSGNFATFTLRAVYGGVTVDRVYTITKARAGTPGTPGEDGATAKSLRVTATAQVFQYGQLGNLLQPSQIAFEAARENSSAAVSWRTQRWNGSAWVDTAANLMSPTTGLASVLTEASFAGSGEASLRVVATMTDGATYSDAITVVRVQDGADGPPGQDGADGADGADGVNAINGLLSNEAHIVPAASDGSGYSLTGAGGTFRVWNGTSDVTGAGPTYSVVGSATVDGLTMSINAATGVYSLAGASWSGDRAAFTLRAVFGGVTIDRIYTIAKSLAGAPGADGSTAISLRVEASAQAFQYDGAGALTSASSITFAASRQNTTATVSWRTQYWNGSAWVDTATNRMSAATGLTSTLTEAAFALENRTALRVVASLTDGETLTDSITVIRMRDGADGTDGTDGEDGTDAILGLLSNEAHLVSAESDGSNYSLTGAGGTFRVWQGATQVTGAGPVYSVVAPATKNGLTISINSTSGVYSLSGASWSTNYETFTLRAVYAGVTIDRVYSIAKSRAGTDTKGLRITASGQVFRYNGAGALIEPTSLVFEAVRENSAATVSWVTQRWNGSAWVNTSTNRMSPTTGLSSTLTQAAFAAEGATSLRVLASMTDGTSYFDAITVMRVADGGDGQDGEDGRGVNIIFRRAASRPATPAASAGIPSGWYDTADLVPASADPLWASVGTQPDSASNWTWQLPFQVEGTPGDPGSPGLSVVQLVIYRRATSSPGTPSGGSFNFGTRVLTPPSGWSLSPPAGTDPVYLARGTATVQGATGTVTPVWSASELAAGNWTPISLEDFASGIEPLVIHSGGTPASVYLGGDVVFYTGDGKLYRWNGSAYIKDVPASDISAGIVNAAITMASNFILTTAGRLYTNGKTSINDTTPGVFLGHDGISNYDFAVGNATKFMKWDGSAGTLEIAGQVISNSLVSNSPMEPSAFRIRAPGTANTCPPIIEDYGISAHPSGVQSLAARSVMLLGFVAPNYNTGADYHFKRFAYHKMDVILESEVVTHSINNYTLTWEYSLNGGLSWSPIKTHTYSGNNTRGTQNSKFRFTTPTSWSTIAFRLSFPSAHCSYMQLTARVHNWVESPYAALSSSSLTDYVEPDPPPPPPGWIEP